MQSAALPRRLALTLLIGLAGCGADARPSPSAEQSEPARPTLGPQLPTPAIAPAAISVVDVAQASASETGTRVFAMLLRGGAGTTAVERRLEIRAWMDPVNGSSCGRPPLPSVLGPGHPDAVQPHLADATRTVVVHSRGDQPEAGAGQSSARFRYGPVPSLNGDFEGWVSFEFPARVDHGFCAFDLRGEVILVASGTARADLPTVRVDTRDRLDGTFDHVSWADRLDDYEGRPSTIDALTADALPIRPFSDEELLDALEGLAVTARAERASLREERPPGGVCYFAAWSVSVEMLGRWRTSVDRLAAQLIDGSVTADEAYETARSFGSTDGQADDLARAIDDARTACAALDAG